MVENMKTKVLARLLLLTFLFFFSSFSIVLADDYQDGFDAYKREDYETAYRLWLPLAGKGHARAQTALGLMYDVGQGVPQDYKEAHPSGFVLPQNREMLMRNSMWGWCMPKGKELHKIMC